MTVLHTDLDNTIIYSYKRDIGPSKLNVELYQGREISFITNKTYNLLKKIDDKLLLVPTTTRTIEQYNRISLGIGPRKYALVCNGGILLVDGKSDEDWYNESKELIKCSLDQLNIAIEYLEKDERRNFELRFIEDLFIFTKCSEPENVVEDLKEVLDETKVDVFNNGIKVYVVPKNLSKGNAILRFKQYIQSDITIAAGDSEFDISMLKEADISYAPHGFKKDYNIDFDVTESNADSIFSEDFLGKILINCD